MWHNGKTIHPLNLSDKWWWTAFSRSNACALCLATSLYIITRLDDKQYAGSLYYHVSLPLLMHLFYHIRDSCGWHRSIGMMLYTAYQSMRCSWCWIGGVTKVVIKIDSCVLPVGGKKVTAKDRWTRSLLHDFLCHVNFAHPQMIHTKAHSNMHNPSLFLLSLL